MTKKKDKKIDKEIKEILTSTDEIEFEKVQGAETSPLTEPIKDKTGEVDALTQQEIQDTVQAPADDQSTPEQPFVEDEIPEQEINEVDEEELENNEEEAEAELPPEYAKLAANSAISTVENLIVAGGSYFVNVKKHEEYFDFPEVIEVIDEHNAKYAEHLKFEKEEKAAMRPLLAEILKKRAKKLTVEQQFLGLFISSMAKRVQTMAQDRAEIKVLESSIRQLILETRQDDVEDDSLEEVEVTEESDTQEGEPQAA
ncbi:MAG: hypothetical protein JXQ90_18300 [Cyclobacteriaceae bacterium]